MSSGGMCRTDTVCTWAICGLCTIEKILASSSTNREQTFTHGPSSDAGPRHVGTNVDRDEGAFTRCEHSRRCRNHRPSQGVSKWTVTTRQCTLVPRSSTSATLSANEPVVRLLSELLVTDIRATLHKTRTSAGSFQCSRARHTANVCAFGVHPLRARRDSQMSESFQNGDP